MAATASNGVVTLCRLSITTAHEPRGTRDIAAGRFGQAYEPPADRAFLALPAFPEPVPRSGQRPARGDKPFHGGRYQIRSTHPEQTPDRTRTRGRAQGDARRARRDSGQIAVRR